MTTIESRRPSKYTKDSGLYQKELDKRNPRGIKSVIPYVHYKEKMTFKCRKGHVFQQFPLSMLEPRLGCPHCKKTRLKTQNEFEADVKRVHKNKILIIGQYQSDTRSVKSQCATCKNSWNPVARDLLNGCGCPTCAKQGRKNQPHKLSHKKYLSLLLQNSSTFIPVEECKGSNNYPIKHKCVKCSHVIKIIPYNLLRLGRLCPKCSKPNNFSKIACQWLDKESRRRRVNIAHAMNGGEYLIPSTRYRADGFCKSTNTVFEFLGNCWHGNLEVYRPKNKCHPYSEATAADLNRKITKRLQEILDLGYRVVYIWETDYYEGLRPKVFEDGSSRV